MWRALIILIGAGAVGALGYLAICGGGPESLAAFGRAPQRIESELQAAAAKALAGRGFDWAQVRMDGQIALLTGEAPKEEERADARAAVLASAGRGGWWRGGVVSVIDRTTLAPPVSPYEWTAVKSEAGVALKGVAPSRTVRADLVAYAKSVFGGAVADDMKIARGAPDESTWASVAREALSQLAALTEGRAVLKDERLRIDGATESAAARDRVRAAIARLPAPFVGVERISAPEPAAAAPGPAAPGDIVDLSEIADAVVCQDLFDRLTKDDAISFGKGEAVIEKESYPLLERLAVAARRCRSLRVVVTGHTDDTGEAEANVKLSEKRAQAVADFLVLRGVETVRVEARGAGGAEPIAPNDTEEGRAKNRRIAFQIAR